MQRRRSVTVLQFVCYVLLVTSISMVGVYFNDPVYVRCTLIERTLEYPSNGYTLFSPMRSLNTYLLDNSSAIVYTWESSYRPALSVYLLENGSILRTAFPGLPSNSSFIAGGGAGGLVQRILWNSTVAWEFTYANETVLLHHDIRPMPDGNVLMIAWEVKTAEEAIAAGRNPALLDEGELWPDHIIEVEPTGATEGNIVWKWHVWDHLIQDYNTSKENYGTIADHPELIDVNFVDTPSAKADWTHINSIDYNEELDQILLSVNGFREIWVIDHSTTTEEAAGHSGGSSGKGGDILYQWGNPRTYRLGGVDDQKFFHLHDAQWIESDRPGGGNLLVFNNGANRPTGFYSSVDEVVPPVDSNGSYTRQPDSKYGPEEQTWIYTAENPTDFYSQGISGTQRLPNGNTLICNGGAGVFFEVTPSKETVWEYTNTLPSPAQNNVFKIRRYEQDYPGLRELLLSNDVAVVDVRVNKTVTVQGQNVTIETEIKNQGSYTETFNVTLYASTTVLDTFTNITLASGNTTTISFTWNTSNVTYGNYTITGYVDPVPGETDTDDNTFNDSWVVITIAGDIDGDNDVDIFDIVSISSVYGVSSPDPRYNAVCDLDEDGDIDIFDVVTASGNYGQSV